MNIYIYIYKSCELKLVFINDRKQFHKTDNFYYYQLFTHCNNIAKKAIM